MKTSSYKFLIILLLSVFVFSSCEKEITIDLPKETPKIVIEGYIENGLPATVIITKSAPYFDPIDITTLLSSIVRNAKVKISDGTNSDILDTVKTSDYPFFFYTGDTIIGEIGKTYILTVEIDGQTYKSQTTIQHPVAFDSIWFKMKPDNDSIGDIFAVGTDNGAEYNYYRVFTKIINKDYTFIPIFGSVWDDKFFNGETFTVQLYHGIASNIMNPDEDWSTSYKLGDTVVTKLCTFDYESYTFWSAAESEIFSGGNPFSTTTSVPTNIKGGAIGCWTGYCASYDTIICKP